MDKPSDTLLDLAAILYWAEVCEETKEKLAKRRHDLEQYLQDEHFGDCIKQPCTCLRCMTEQYIDEATAIRDYLKERGWIIRQ